MRFLKATQLEIKTHMRADSSLVGRAVLINDDVEAVVELTADKKMAVDEMGLIHGGFTFGLADYAAMLAVNHPYVVLGSSEVRFLAPVKVGDVMTARARVVNREGRQREVSVDVFVGEKKVLTGTMICYILREPVLKH
jgi:uncharacterized protein (TIGR00369 family)